MKFPVTKITSLQIDERCGNVEVIYLAYTSAFPIPKLHIIYIDIYTSYQTNTDFFTVSSQLISSTPVSNIVSKGRLTRSWKLKRKKNPTVWSISFLRFYHLTQSARCIFYSSPYKDRDFSMNPSTEHNKAIGQNNISDLFNSSISFPFFFIC